MAVKRTIALTEDNLLRIEQIVIDNDKDEALDFIKEVVKRQIDRENAAKIKRAVI